MASGHITVKVGRVPGTIKEIVLNGDRSVAMALQTAEIAAEGLDIRVNGEPATLGGELEEGDMVLLTKPVKGN